MKRVLLITNQFPPDIGGVQTFNKELALFLSKSYNLSVCCLKTQGFKNNNYKLLNYLTPLNETNRIAYLLKNLTIIIRTIKAIKPDLIISGNYYPIALLVSLANKRIPHIIYGHGLEFFQAKENFVINNLLKILVKNSHLVLNSSYCKQILQKRRLLYPRKVSVIPPVFPSERFFKIIKMARLTRSSNKIRILSFGRLVRRKNLDMVIRVLSKLSYSDLNKIEYHIYGEGPEQASLRMLIDSYELGNIVFLHKFIPLSSLLNKLCNSDIFITPSREFKDDIEGYGIVYFEAICAKLKVIASFSSGGPDLKQYFGDQISLVNPENDFELLGLLKKCIAKNYVPRYDNETKIHKYFMMVTDKWKKLISQEFEV